MYIWERKAWPTLEWESHDITKGLLFLRHQQGRLRGGMASIGFRLCEESFLATLTQDVVKSSEIEGEILDKSLVRSSVARHLGMKDGAVSAADRTIDGIVEMTIDATQNFMQPLTKERLFDWHTKLFPYGRSGFSKINSGGWRTGPVQVISGHLGKERVHFEGPPAERVDYEMTLFFDWFNSQTTMDPLLQGALAHLWFVSIHPFEDGNGRIGRAIADLLLARSEQSPHRFYSLSRQIQIERKDYYTILERTQKGDLHITPWIEWFFGCLSRAIEHSLDTLDRLLYKGRFWEAFGELPINQRQKKMINRLLDGFDGKLSTSTWAKMAKCSQDTAYRDISELVAWGILVKNSAGGRSTSYSLNRVSVTASSS